MIPLRMCGSRGESGRPRRGRDRHARREHPGEGGRGRGRLEGGERNARDRRRGRERASGAGLGLDRGPGEDPRGESRGRQRQDREREGEREREQEREQEEGVGRVCVSGVGRWTRMRRLWGLLEEEEGMQLVRWQRCWMLRFLHVVRWEGLHRRWLHRVTHIRSLRHRLLLGRRHGGRLPWDRPSGRLRTVPRRLSQSTRGWPISSPSSPSRGAQTPMFVRYRPPEAERSGA